MKSNWETTRARSKYHFDIKKWDPKWDGVEQLGHIQPNWHTELQQAISASQPVTWRTRGKPGDQKTRSAACQVEENRALSAVGAFSSALR